MPFHSAPPIPLLLHVFLPHLPPCVLSLVVDVDANVFFRAEPSTVVYSQHFDQLRVSLLTVICCNEEVSLTKVDSSENNYLSIQR